MRKKTFWALVLVLCASFLISGTLAFAQDGSDLPEDDFVLQADNTPPEIQFKVLPNNPTAKHDRTTIEISTENMKSNELTEGVFMEVIIDYPPKRLLVPSDEPALEGTRLFASEFTSKQGVVLLEDVLFPISGRYLVTVNARAIDGQAFEPITETFKIGVGAPWTNVIVWTLLFIGMIVLGTFMSLRKKKGGRKK